MTVRFPDLNTWHRVNDWAAFARAYPVAACRATMGTAEVDDYFAPFLVGCQRAGILPVAYHRLRPGQAIGGQVDHFLSLAGSQCAYALDVETTKGAAREPTMSEANTFVDLLTQRTGRPRSHVLSYLPKWWYDANGAGARVLRDTTLWASRYTLPIDWSGYAGFSTVAIMQFSQQWPIVGVGIGDMNEWRGSLDELKTLLGFKLDTADKQWIEARL